MNSINDLSDRHIAMLLEPYRFTPNKTFFERTRAYIELLLRWNRTISLTTVIDPSKIVEFHFGESLFALSTGLFQNGRLADVGSGAGFPGIPLAMASPSLSVELIESNSKKSAFLAEAIRVLSLENCRIIRSRFENLPFDRDSQVRNLNFVVSRALGQFELLMDWANNALMPSGIIALWIGGTDLDLVSQTDRWAFTIRLAIPNSERRFILIGSPA
jgi:16S rRNA (guanine527-N7)-methyltransferase